MSRLEFAEWPNRETQLATKAAQGNAAAWTLLDSVEKLPRDEQMRLVEKGVYEIFAAGLLKYEPDVRAEGNTAMARVDWTIVAEQLLNSRKLQTMVRDLFVRMRMKLPDDMPAVSILIELKFVDDGVDVITTTKDGDKRCCAICGALEPDDDAPKMSHLMIEGVPDADDPIFHIIMCSECQGALSAEQEPN